MFLAPSVLELTNATHVRYSCGSLFVYDEKWTLLNVKSNCLNLRTVTGSLTAVLIGLSVRKYQVVSQVRTEEAI